MKADTPQHFINRELSWLEFNGRVLHEALDADNPLLERLKFLVIVSSNLDEFFMIRVGGLKQEWLAGSRKRCPAGLTSRQQLVEISRRAHQMVERQYACLIEEIIPALAAHGIHRFHPGTLDPGAAETARRYFDEEVFPILTPVAVEEDNFPRIAALTLHLAMRLRKTGGKEEGEGERLALVPLPRTWPRYFQIPSPSGYQVVLLEDLVTLYAESLFSGYEVIEAAAFRLTRNADVPVDEDVAGDLLQAMEGVLRDRKSGGPVRLEIAAGASPGLTRRLVSVFGVDEKLELYRIPGILDLAPFMSLASQIDIEGLRYPPYEPQPVAPFEGAASFWDVVRERDVLIHLPYESFDPVVRMVEEAADDPQVMAIKQTLYRTSSDSPIVKALTRAASKGKQVSVLVELKARFSEEQNIAWAQQLAEAGAQVVYGVMGLKTHGKCLMVIRREADGARRYVHLSTGNYHDKTARLYEDIGLFTCDRDIGADASNFFNAVTGYSEPRDWRQLVIAPTSMRERLYQLIDREVARSSREDPGMIQIKLNSFLDPDLCLRLYEASQKWVRVKLCIRGICCLRPGVEKLSENIEVISIVGRYLEHSRIFHFRNGGQDEVYLSSADWMPRNLDRRIEIMFPVNDDDHKRRLIHVLDVAFSDNQRAWRLLPDGAYERLQPAPGEPKRQCQEMLMREAIERAEATRLRQLSVFHPQGPGVAPGAA